MSCVFFSSWIARYCFPLRLLRQSLFLRPGGQNRILDERLGDGAGALLPLKAAGNGHIGDTHDALNINSVMLIKTCVLHGDKSVRQILRDLIHGHRDPVGILRHQLCDLIAFRIIDKGRKTAGCRVLQIDGGCGIYNTLKNAQGAAYADNSKGQHTHKHRFGDGQKEFTTPAHGG